MTSGRRSRSVTRTPPHPVRPAAGSRPMRPRLHGPHGTSRRGGGLGLGQLREVPQRQHLAVPDGKGRDRRHQALAGIGCRRLDRRIRCFALSLAGDPQLEDATGAPTLEAGSGPRSPRSRATTAESRRRAETGPGAGTPSPTHPARRPPRRGRRSRTRPGGPPADADRSSRERLAISHQTTLHELSIGIHRSNGCTPLTPTRFPMTTRRPAATARSSRGTGGRRRWPCCLRRRRPRRA